MLITNDSSSFALNNRLSDSLNYFLAEISGKIQLTKTQREKAEGHYGAMVDLLKNGPSNSLLSQLDIKMIPFGGLGTNTATKPHSSDEFDLDLIIKFLAPTSRFGSASVLYGEVFDRLNSLEGYKDRIEKKDRCVRVYYAGDFYLDLMPSAVEQDLDPESGKLWIPERQADGRFKFVLVDPLGLMNWFERKASIETKLNETTFDKRGSIEAMPLISEDARKSSLKQAVQLIKRVRDVYFVKDDDCKKILKSVVILTVAGQSFSGESDLYRLISKIIIALEIRTENLFTCKLENPVYSQEDFFSSLRKKPERHRKLRTFISDFKNSWSLLGQESGNLEFRKTALNKLFGESVTGAVLSEYVERMEKAYRNQSVRMAPSGLLGISAAKAGLAVPRHQFFGD